MDKIEKVLKKLGVKEEEWCLYGKYAAKISLSIFKRLPKKEGKLILVTSINPTKSGEGKTTVSIGLCDALNRIGEKTIVTIRQPSLGPIFGIKGGATGGGKSVVVPRDRIDFHLTGDIHKVSDAHNLLSAMIDNHIYYDNELGIEKVIWPRTVDLTDRALRSVRVGIWGKKKTTRKDTFIITAASEVMSILSLSENLADMKEKLGRIIVGKTKNEKNITAKDLKAHGAMTKLMERAIIPNIVQTAEGNPAFIHGGPFANFSHGTNSIISTRLALRLVGANGFVVTESGFGTDLGAEKFVNIVSRYGFDPCIAVVVVTIKALRYHGEDNIQKGIENNLKPHISNVIKLGMTPIVAINKFGNDKPDDIKLVKEFCKQKNIGFSVVDFYKKGSKGGVELAKLVSASSCSITKPLYQLKIPIKEKIRIVANEMYGIEKIRYTPKANKQAKEIGSLALPICIVKSQHELRPKNFTIRNFEVMAGAGFIIVETGKTIRMPGMPKHPRAEEM